MKPLAPVLALMLVSSSALAEGAYQNVDELRLIKELGVYVSDKVRDGCLPNPDILRVEAELILRQSGIKVSREPSEFFLSIEAGGWENKTNSGQGWGWCVMRLDVHLRRIALAPEGHVAIIQGYASGSLMSGVPKTKAQERLREDVSLYISDLANEILKAQGN